MVIGEATTNDITDQVSGWLAVNQMLRSREDELKGAWASLDIDHVHFTGCGSVNFLAHSGAALLQSAVGIPASSGPGAAFYRASDLPVARPDRTLLIAVSRSGETTETLDAVRTYRAAGGAAVWCITTRSGSSLADVADFVLAEDSAFEASIVQTRSFASMLGMIQGMTEVISGGMLVDDNMLSDAGEKSLAASRLAIDNFDAIDSCDRVIFLGSGAVFGLAQEGQLLMNEIALCDSASHEMLDFRHGPISMVDEATVVVGLLDAGATDLETAVLDDVASLGGAVLTISSGPAGPSSQTSIGVDPNGTRLLSLLMPPMQLLALRRAKAHNIDPDHPRHLSAVVRLGHG